MTRRNPGLVPWASKCQVKKTSSNKGVTMARTKFSATFLLIFCVSLHAQTVEDQLFLQDGRERVGRLVTMDGGEIKFEVDGVAQTFPRSDVQRIELADIRAGDGIRNVADLNDPLLDRILQVSPATFVYRDSGYVTMYHLIERRLHEDGSFTERKRIIRKVLLERGKDLANVAAYYRKGIESLEVDFARTINPDGSVTPITEAAIDVTSVNTDTPEYDRQQQLKFAMKQVVEGSILDYQFTKRGMQTNLLEPFAIGTYFRDSEPIMEKELRITMPRGRQLLYSMRRAKHVTLKTTESDEGTTYSFSAKIVSRFIPEAQMPPIADCMPEVVVAEQATWSEIGNAYRLAVLAKSSPTSAIKKKVRALIADASNQKEIATNIYYHVTQSIRQVWVGPSAYQYAPHPVGEVFDRSSGNTMDKVALLRSMLIEAGIKVEIVLCRSRHHGKLLETIPMIRQFDDALVAVTLESGRHFLAVDDETARFGQLPSEYQGTRGLLISAQDAHLIDIPLFGLELESVASTYRMIVSPSGDLTVTETQKPTGNYEMGYRAAWKDSKDEDLRKGLEMTLASMHATAKLQDFEIRNLRDVTKPLVFTQTYTLAGYAFGNEDILVFRIPILDYSAGAVGKPTREFPLIWDNQFKATKDLTITFPKDYRVYYAGKNFEATSDATTFYAQFDHTHDTITYVDEYLQKVVEAPVEAYEGYKACLETMARVPKEWVVLEKISAN